MCVQNKEPLKKKERRRDHIATIRAFRGTRTAHSFGRVKRGPAICGESREKPSPGVPKVQVREGKRDGRNISGKNDPVVLIHQE